MSQNPIRKVLIIEDNEDIAELVHLHLGDLNCSTVRITDGLQGWEEAKKGGFDLIILDLNLPSMSGLEICRLIRQGGNEVPILMLTALSEEIDKVAGLEMGADDYITKPFGIKEFIARVRAIFRRSMREREDVNNPQENISYKGLFIERNKRRVTLNDEGIDLTPKEYDLLLLLASNPGITYDRKDLLNKVWGYDFEGYEHTVNSHINRLRSKIEKDLNHPYFVLTTWGIGYRFNDK